MFDIITVVHNEINYGLAYNRLLPSLEKYSNHDYNFWVRDNRLDNIGFAKACNEMAWLGNQPIIGFVNPDAFVDNFFMDIVINTLKDDVVITGCNYGKNPVEVRGWGLNDWVCGASMFVTRDWFTELGGFDERFIWSHEETDFIRQTEVAGKVCKSYSEAEFRIVHSSPSDDSSEDSSRKQMWFADASRKYQQKWM